MRSFGGAVSVDDTLDVGVNRGGGCGDQIWLPINLVVSHLPITNIFIQSPLISANYSLLTYNI